MTKAFDNRVGMAGAIQVGQEAEAHCCRLIVAGSVQEELGLRGAKTLANATKPDVAIVLEGPPADDTPGMPLSESQGAIGGGVQIRLHDPSAIMNPRLGRFCHRDGTGGRDSSPSGRFARVEEQMPGHFNIANEGIPSVVLGTPARYIHSHNGIINEHDYHAMVALSLAMVKRLDQSTVDGFTSYL